jgi:hypothetical protein
MVFRREDEKDGDEFLFACLSGTYQKQEVGFVLTAQNGRILFAPGSGRSSRLWRPAAKPSLFGEI